MHDEYEISMERVEIQINLDFASRVPNSSSGARKIVLVVLTLLAEPWIGKDNSNSETTYLWGKSEKPALPSIDSQRNTGNDKTSLVGSLQWYIGHGTKFDLEWKLAIFKNLGF